MNGSFRNSFPISYILLLLPLLLMSISPLFAQTVKVKVILSNQYLEKGELAYFPNQLLDFSDFQGPANHKSPAAALTSSGIKLHISSLSSQDQTEVEIVLSTYFDKRKSWFKSNAKTSSLLLHEQGHFWLTVLQTCALLNDLNSYSYTSNWNQEIKQIYHDHLDELEKKQELYDQETLHGTNDFQEHYNLEFKKSIESLSCFL